MRALILCYAPSVKICRSDAAHTHTLYAVRWMCTCTECRIIAFGRRQQQCYFLLLLLLRWHITVEPIAPVYNDIITRAIVVIIIIIIAGTMIAVIMIQ